MTSFFKRSNSQHQTLPEEPPAKRISTPAGQRLSVILENGDTNSKTRDTYRVSVRKSGLTSAALGDAPRESIEEHSAGSSGYTYSVWSDGEKFGKIRNHKSVAKRGGWKRLAIIIAIIIALIIALAAGLAIGLKKKSSSSNSPSDPQSPSPASTSTPTSPSPQSPSSPSSSSLPSNFPLGTFSLVTFLDTIQTNCTALSSTWTCYPYTIYNSSPSKSLAVLNWEIKSSSSSKSKLAISSTKNPFSIEFSDVPLEFLDQGMETERYRFQIVQEKKVAPEKALTKDGATVECKFPDTSLQAVLYTKMAKTFPSSTESDGNPSFPAWPFAVRIEQSAAGGSNVPACKKTGSGETVTEGLEAQDQSTLCSCLYKNWRTTV
ncbi:hypothetical protein B0J11DRAFT_22578 [Dendryphion nanum]|uniref:Tat pathway signal sequence n=1 Tax=Dendryphion nanum TaxID=256645 RepID=A0A9P9EIW6_9PLEO|nr:hypothetical protein B0J11DRAFT_22578 [Dendryphion nanum]